MMDKEKVKEQLGVASAKAKDAFAEIKANFKADDGTTGFRKVQSMFVNLWKSGTTGKGALIACSVFLFLFLMMVFGSSEKSAGNAEASVVTNEDTTKKAMADIARAQEEAVAAVARVKQEATAMAARAEEQAAAAAVRAQDNEKTAAARAQNVSAAKEEIEIKDVESAKKALRAAYASGDVIAANRVQETLTRLEKQEAKKKAEREAKERAELEAKEEAEEAARVAKAKAEQEAKEAAKRAAFEAIPDKLVVKGLYAGMPGDSALEACKQLVAKEGDLVVVDYRKGIDREKDEETKAKEKKDWDARVKLAETDIDLFQKWNSWNHGYVYNPSVEKCEGRIPNSKPRLPSGDQSAAVPHGADSSLASAMTCFAAIYGYQVEWMLPGRRSGAENTKEPQPQMVSIETLKSAEFDKLGGVGRMLDLFAQSDNNFDKRLYPNVYDKGLRTHRKCKGRLLFRLVPQDSAGKPIEKSDLATEIACEFPDLFEKGISKVEIMKKAEKYVDAISTWVDVRYERYRASATKVKTNKTSRLVEDMFSHKINNTDVYSFVMNKLAAKASVEYAVFVEPAEKFEQVTEVFTIPASKWEEATQFMRKMDFYKLGNMDIDHAVDRKKVFFKHDLEDILSPVWYRLVLKTTNGVEVTRDEVVKNWLTARGHYKPSERVKIPPKNLIQVSINQEGVPDNKLKGLCFVRTDEADNVKETYYNAEGMNRFFDAKDLSGEEFANLLVNNYPGLPSLKMNLEKKNPGRGIIEERTWTYSCPKGYQVELFERSYININGVKYDSKMLERDPEVAMALSLVDMLPNKYLSISATKAASARKFD